MNGLSTGRTISVSSGSTEVVVQAFPEPHGTVHISRSGGSSPRWSTDGKKIYFIAPDGVMMAASVETAGSTIKPGTPSALFPTKIYGLIFKHEYTVSADGFLVVTREGREFSPINLILNWKP